MSRRQADDAYASATPAMIRLCEALSDFLLRCSTQSSRLVIRRRHAVLAFASYLMPRTLNTEQYRYHTTYLLLPLHCHRFDIAHIPPYHHYLPPMLIFHARSHAAALAFACSSKLSFSCCFIEARLAAVSLRAIFIQTLLPDAAYRTGHDIISYNASCQRDHAQLSFRRLFTIFIDGVLFHCLRRHYLRRDDDIFAARYFAASFMLIFHAGDSRLIHTLLRD